MSFSTIEVKRINLTKNVQQKYYLFLIEKRSLKDLDDSGQIHFERQVLALFRTKKAC